MTLVLDGAFADENGRYARGDACVTDETVTHRPEAERARDCVCLLVSEGPIRLTGRFMRLLNPLMPR
jgi:putative transcriptional regulator